MSHRLADGVVVNSRVLRDYLIDQEDFPAEFVHLCANGLNARGFSRSGAVPEGVAPPGALVVGSLCNLRPEKNLTVLLKAFAVCSIVDPRLLLLLVGSGPELDALQKEAAELNVLDRCRFQPAVADVAPWLSLMDIFVLPSRSEALPNALMEAMASACACIGSRVGGIPELVEPDVTGLLFESGDVASLASCLQRLSRDGNLRTRLGVAAADRIRGQFSLDAAAGRLGTVYEHQLGIQAASTGAGAGLPDPPS
jgi:glycosyltransferase involved in cell wall biosynthesis